MRNMILTGVVVMLGVSTSLTAQRRVSPEHLLQMRQRLELTEDQVTQLQRLRTELLTQRTAQMTQRLALQSRLRAGDITRAEYREALGNQRTSRADRDSVAARVQGVLTEEQQNRLRQRADRSRRVRARASQRSGRQARHRHRGRGEVGFRMDRRGRGANRRMRSRRPGG